MQIIDRYTGKILNDSNLPGDIELGRYAISMGSTYKELTSKSYKVQEGQRIHQELLDDVNKDKHNIFEIISESVENGDFRSIPLLQGIKNGLEFGDFATQMEEDFKHIEAIFHAPYSKLNRTIEKVPVSRAKRISNRSNQYLAAHTEDWLHKGLVSFRPSRILTEEIISDENVFENQLVIALVTRAAHHLERKLRYTRDITEFLIEYSKLIEKHEKSEDCWYKKVRRELSLAGKVYDEQSGNYKAANADIQIVTSTMKRLKKLRDSLLKLRQYDLFYNVPARLKYLKSLQSELANIVENLGYDGFFNFEFDEDKSHCNDQFSKPSIGIFGDDLSDKLVYLGVQPIEQLKSFKYNDIHDSDIREVSLHLKAIAKISKSEDEFYEKVEKFYNDYPNFYSTLTKKDYLELAKGMYKPLTESQLFENIMKHEKAYNGKMEEYGWKVPPKEI